jgi:hypothetical protein
MDGDCSGLPYTVCQEAEEEGEGIPPARCVCMPGIKLITPEGKQRSSSSSSSSYHHHWHHLIIIIIIINHKSETFLSSL